MRKDGGEIAAFAKASGEQTRLKGYIERGRRLLVAAQTSFKERSCRPPPRWGEDPAAPLTRIETGDTSSEYLLRGRKPQYSFVQRHIDLAIAKIAAGVECFSEERKQEIDDELFREYDDAHVRKN